MIFGRPRLQNGSSAVITSASRITVRHEAGTLSFVDRSEGYPLLREMKKTGRFYEQEMLEDIRGRVRPDELVADVGACVGTHTIFLASICACRVLAFEPYPPSLDLLREHVDLNTVGDRVRIFPFALGASHTKGAARVRAGPQALSTAVIEPSPKGPIEVVPLASLAIPDPITLLKIDVEGMEVDVLRGAETVIRRDGPLIYVECFEQGKLDAIHDFLEPLRYVLVNCFNATPTFLFARCDSDRVSAADRLLDRKFSRKCVEELNARRHRWREKEAHDRTTARQAERAAIEHRERLSLEQALRDAQDDLQRAQADLVQERARGADAVKRWVDERVAEVRRRARLERDLNCIRARLTGAEQNLARLQENALVTSLYGVTRALDPLVRFRTDPLFRADLKRAWAFDLRAGRRPLGHRILPRREDRAEIERLAAACRHKAGIRAPADVVVSIVLYVRDDARTLRDSLRSILEQSLAQIEVIAVDDASDDGSFEILDTILREEERLRVFRLTNRRGAAWAMSYGMTQARGPFVAFQEAHRAAAPHRLLWQLGRMVEDGASAQVARNPSGQFRESVSDLMLAIDPAVIEVGYFDDVPFGFAQEYRWRLRAALSPRHISLVDESFLPALHVPLAKKRKHPKMTREMRSEYLSAARAWHRVAKRERDALFRPFPESAPLFDAPSAMRSAEPRSRARVASLLYGPRRHERVRREIESLLPNVDHIDVYSRFPIVRDDLPRSVKIRYHCGHPAAAPDGGSAVAYFVEVEPGLGWMDPALSREEEVTHRIVGAIRTPPSHRTSNQEERFSIVMAAYNSADTIGRAIASICEQSYENWELIVVDDGSDDSTPEIVRSKAVEDDRIRIVGVDENRGPYWCRNIGIQHATGEYVTFQDADDRSLAHRLEMTAAAMCSSPAVAAARSMIHRRDASGRYQMFGGRFFRAGTITLTLRSDFLREKVGYFDAVRYCGDSELLERVKSLVAPEALKFLPVTLYEALQSARSQTSHPTLGLSGSRFAGTMYLSPTRLAYVEAYRAWHKRIRAEKARGYLEFPLVRRPFPAPAGLIPDPSASLPADKSAPATVGEKLPPPPAHFTERLAQYRQAGRRLLALGPVGLEGTEPPSMPLVTVVTPTNRPSQLRWSLQNFLRQWYPRKELIIVLNSAEFDVEAIRRQVALFGDVTVTFADDQYNVGYCLNSGEKAANGEIIAKFDDDDYYGPSYLTEQVATLEQTGAWVVGKSSWLCYLSRLDKKILRAPGRDNSWTRHVAGATFMIRRELLQEVGFREDLVGNVDTTFLAEVQDRGYRLYSSSIFNFCVIRGKHSSHNWGITDEEIMNRGLHLCDGFHPAVIDGLISPR